MPRELLLVTSCAIAFPAIGGSDPFVWGDSSAPPERDSIRILSAGVAAQSLRFTGGYIPAPSGLKAMGLSRESPVGKGN